MAKKKVDEVKEEVVNEESNPGGVNDVVDSTPESNTGEAKGSVASEAASEIETPAEDTTAAPAEVESEDEVEIEEVAGEVTAQPVVVLTFSKDKIMLDVTDEFQIALRETCQEMGERPSEFKANCDLDPEKLRLLKNACK